MTVAAIGVPLGEDCNKDCYEQQEEEVGPIASAILNPAVLSDHRAGWHRSRR